MEMRSNKDVLLARFVTCRQRRIKQDRGNRPFAVYGAWYKNHIAGCQTTQWDFKKKGY